MPTSSRAPRPGVSHEQACPRAPAQHRQHTYSLIVLAGAPDVGVLACEDRGPLLAARIAAAAMAPASSAARRLRQQRRTLAHATARPSDRTRRRLGSKRADRAGSTARRAHRYAWCSTSLLLTFAPAAARTATTFTSLDLVRNRRLERRRASKCGRSTRHSSRAVAQTRVQLLHDLVRVLHVVVKRASPAEWAVVLCRSAASSTSASSPAVSTFFGR